MDQYPTFVWAVFELLAESNKSEKLPDRLTCGRFHSLWKQTEGTSEGPRFRAVLRMLQEQPAAKSPITLDLGPVIIKEFADGKWHKLETIIRHLDAPQEQVEATLRLMESKRKHSCKCEREKVGKTFQYRIFKQDKTVSVSELTEKLRPFVDGLKIEGKKNMATMSPGTVARLAALIERQLDEWDE